MMKQLATRQARGCLIYVAAAVFILPLGFCLVLLPLWLVFTFDAGIGLLIASLVLFFVIAFGVPLAYMGTVVLRRQRTLDAALTPLGLQGGGLPVAGANYHGRVEGRPARFALQRGPLLNLIVATPIQTRFAAQRGTRDAPRQVGKQVQFAYGELLITTLDEAWARSVLAEEAITEGLLRLTAPDERERQRQVVLTPGTLRLRLYGNNQLFGLGFEGDDLRAWFGELVRLAAALDDQPAPTVTAEASGIERTMYGVTP